MHYISVIAAIKALWFSFFRQVLCRHEANMTILQCCTRAVQILLQGRGFVLHDNITSSCTSLHFRPLCPSNTRGDAYSTNISDTRLRVHLDCNSEGFSMDVSETRTKQNRGREDR